VKKGGARQVSSIGITGRSRRGTAGSLYRTETLGPEDILAMEGVVACRVCKRGGGPNHGNVAAVILSKDSGGGGK